MGNVDFGQGEGTLTRAAGLVRDARADFERLSSQLSDQISAVQGRWGGEGARAFFVLHQAWSEKQSVIVRALDGFAESLGDTERENINADQNQASSMNTIAAGLDATAVPPTAR